MNNFTLEAIDTLFFDIDGTLYDICDVIKSIYELQVAYVHQMIGMKREDIVELFNKNSIFPYKSEKSKSATELFGRLGFNLQDWSKFKNAKFDLECIDLSKSINPIVISELSGKYRLFAITSNTEFNSRRILSKLGMNTEWFTVLLTSESFFPNKTFQKKRAMSWLIKKYGLNSHRILSIGDRYDTDIRPMLELGGNGILLYEPHGLIDFFKENPSMEEKVSYKLFCCEKENDYSSHQKIVI